MKFGFIYASPNLYIFGSLKRLIFRNNNFTELRCPIFTRRPYSSSSQSASFTRLNGFCDHASSRYQKSLLLYDELFQK